MRTIIDVRVETLMRMTVAREKSLEPKHVAMMRVANDDRSPDAAFEQTHASQYQRAHDAFAEISLFDHQIAKTRRRDHDGLDVGDCKRIDERRTSRQLREFAHKTADAVRHDRIVTHMFFVRCHA